MQLKENPVNMKY